MMTDELCRKMGCLLMVMVMHIDDDNDDSSIGPNGQYQLWGK
jgi:hypothetical protein